MPNYDIRPFCDQDREAIAEFRNNMRPPHHRRTVAEWKRNDGQRPAGEVLARLVAGDPAIAYLGAVDRGTTARRKPGVCGFDLWIDPEHWSHDLANALYAKVEEFARSRDAVRLTTYLTLYDANDPIVPFLIQQGFVEVDRIAPVMLDLTTFDPQQFTPSAPAGIRFFSYAEAGDSDENRHKLYALTARIDPDVPTNEGRSETQPFDQFVKNFDRLEWDSNSLILAASDGGEWVGVSQIGFQDQTNIGWTFLTGVHREYRGQGIALALKLRAIDAAIARGCPLILTENHEENAPMRAINKKLGFVPDAPGVSYSKNLSPTH